MLENIKNLIRRKINKQQDSSQLEDQENEEKFNVLNFKLTNNNNKNNNNNDDNDIDNDSLNSLDSSDSNETLGSLESSHADESKISGIVASNTSPNNNDITTTTATTKDNNNKTNMNGNIYLNEKIINESSDYINKYSNYYEELPKNYKLLNQLGEGAFSKVYKAIDLNNNQIIAIKIIDKSNMNIQQINSILKEITIMSKLNHKNIVKLLSYKNNSTSKFCFLFLEYCNGGEIFNKIIEYTYFSEDLSRHIILQVCLSIKYLHDEVGVVHRDIKPENLLFEQIEFSKRSTSLQNSCKRKSDDSNKIDEGNFIHGKGGATIGVVKLADFGLSKILWDQNTNTPCGTVGYTAPEIVKDEYYSKKVDVWAIGCVLYTLLCGFPPFYDTDPKILAKKVSRGDYCFLSPWWDEISQQAKDLVSNLLTLDPSKRYNIDQLLMDPWMTKGYSIDEFNYIKNYIKKTNNSKYSSNTNNNYYNNSIGSPSSSSFPLPQTSSPSLNATDTDTNNSIRERSISNSESIIAQNLSQNENKLNTTATTTTTTATTGNLNLINEIDPFNLIGKKADDAPPSITVDHDLFKQFNNLSNDELTIYHQNLTNQLNNQFNGASTSTKSNNSNSNNNSNNSTNNNTSNISHSDNTIINTTPHRNSISGILANSNSNNNTNNPTDLPTSPTMIQKLGLIATPRGEAIKMVFDTGNVIQRISSPLLSPVNNNNINNNNNAAEKYKILEDEEFSINGNIRQKSISPSNIDAALEEEEQEYHSGNSMSDNNNNNNASIGKVKSRFGELKISKGTANNKTQFAPGSVESIKEDEIAKTIEGDEYSGRRRKSSSVSFTIIPKIHQQNNRSHRNSSVTSNNSELNNALSNSYTESRNNISESISSTTSITEGKNGSINDDTNCITGENNTNKSNRTVKIAREHHEEHPLHTRHSQHNGNSTNNNLLGVSGTFQNHSLLPKTPIDSVCKKLELMNCNKNHEHACNCQKQDESFDDLEESDEDDDDEDDDVDEDDDSDLDSDDSILGNHPKIELREYVKAKNNSISSESSIPKTPFPVKAQNKKISHHENINSSSSDILVSPSDNNNNQDDDNKRSDSNSTTLSSSKIRPSTQSVSSTIYDDEIMNNQDSGNPNQSSEDFLDKMNRRNDAFDLKMDTSKMLLRRKQIGSVGCGIKETPNTVDINNFTENK
ncbi:protein serine/threonine kinase activity protein [[Candida] boidinii]|nr:protein serine/threonine kinase activity protein [[Candida] boidinii]